MRLHLKYIFGTKNQKLSPCAVIRSILIYLVGPIRFLYKLVQCSRYVRLAVGLNLCRPVVRILVRVFWWLRNLKIVQKSAQVKNKMLNFRQYWILYTVHNYIMYRTTPILMRSSQAWRSVCGPIYSDSFLTSMMRDGFIFVPSWDSILG